MALRALFKPLDLLPNGSVSYLYSRQCREQHLLCSLAEDWQCRCGDHWAIRGKKRKWWVQIGNRQTPEQNDVGSSLAQRYWIGRGTRRLPLVSKQGPTMPGVWSYDIDTSILTAIHLQRGLKATETMFAQFTDTQLHLECTNRKEGKFQDWPGHLYFQRWIQELPYKVRTSGHTWARQVQARCAVSRAWRQFSAHICRTLVCWQAALSKNVWNGRAAGKYENDNTQPRLETRSTDPSQQRHVGFRHPRFWTD